jgi:hypothetical protein
VMVTLVLWLPTRLISNLSLWGPLGHMTAHMAAFSFDYNSRLVPVPCMHATMYPLCLHMAAPSTQSLHPWQLRTVVTQTTHSTLKAALPQGATLEGKQLTRQILPVCSEPRM